MVSTGVTFQPAAVESLTHFPIVLAAHMADGGLVLMVEVIDGALGKTTASALGERLLCTGDLLVNGIANLVDGYVNEWPDVTRFYQELMQQGRDWQEIGGGCSLKIVQRR